MRAIWLILLGLVVGGCSGVGSNLPMVGTAVSEVLASSMVTPTIVPMVTPTIAPTLTPTVAPTMTATDYGWTLVWYDEFDSETINPQHWTYDLGAGGWGNNERQYYTNRPENARIENGELVIEAREEAYEGAAYTSARLKTQGLVSWEYGRIEARMKLPVGQGIWPAFWMLGDNFGQVGWPRSGEIDIMEFLGHDLLTSYGTVHGPGYSGGSGIGGHYDAAESLADGYHVYAVEWTPYVIEWFVDDTRFFQLTPGEVPGDWVFDHPFFIILNVAVGGAWPGYPDETTTFPQQLRVDYVRVYQKEIYPTVPVVPTLTPTLAPTPLRLSLLQVSVAGAEVSVLATVVDATGQPVADATVAGTWIGAGDHGDTTLTTDSTGVAGPFTATLANADAAATFCVTRISKTGYMYDTIASVDTCIASTNN